MYRRSYDNFEILSQIAVRDLSSLRVAELTAIPEES